jgi:hypothetical protein
MSTARHPPVVLGGLGQLQLGQDAAHVLSTVLSVTRSRVLRLRRHNTCQVEELVSHGYIVTTIDQRYAASVVFPDGRQAVGLSRDQMRPLVRASYTPVATTPTLNGQTSNDGIVPYLAQDARFTLDRLDALTKPTRTASSPAGWTCGVPRFSASRWAASSPGRPAAQYPEVALETRRSLSAH